MVGIAGDLEEQKGRQVGKVGGRADDTLLLFNWTGRAEITQ